MKVEGLGAGVAEELWVDTMVKGNKRVDRERSKCMVV